MKNMILTAITVATLILPALGFADGFWRQKDVAAVDNPVYQEECGACHFAYQPGLLPARSWEKVMAPKALESHFGDNAELENDVRMALANYLQKNSADKANYKRSRKIMASLRDRAPLRITDTPYIQRKHREIPNRMIQGNTQVKTLSACDACHKDAIKGMYDDDGVSVPGFGRWEDD